MLEKVVEELIGRTESVWLEFKSFWYWNEDDKEINVCWGEFLKDFSALFNSQEKGETKYLIIGFDEKNKTCRNYYIDTNGKAITVIRNLDEFRKSIVSKLKKHFSNIPEYRTSSKLVDIDTLFNIDTVIINGCRLLVITFYPAPYLLQLNKQLQGSETFREGNIIVRRLKLDGSPENTNANFEEVELLKSVVEKKQESDYPHKDTSIEKVVQAFKEKVFPSSEILESKVEHNYTSGIHFEIFTIQGEYHPLMCFIYFSSYTSQNKTFEHIKINSLIENSARKIVLVDTINRNGGHIDKQRIETLFCENYSDVEVHYLEEFALDKLYKDLFDPQIFHQGNFNIKNFVHPYTDMSDGKTAELLLLEWYNSIRKPLLVMKGIGGIGKTTVVKFFLDMLQEKLKQNINILFINSNEIINDIMRNPKIEDIFDFYRILAQKYNIAKRFDKNLLELSIDNGNLIIALDGIDEVIAKCGSKFNIILFIQSIFENYSVNLERAKILITCRDYFWDKNSVPYPVQTITLKPFNKELAEKYFRYAFKSNESKLKKAMNSADNFALNKEENNYIPYILDMVKDDLLSEHPIRKVDSRILQAEDDLNDHLVGKVCEREIRKLENVSIDKQVQVFIRMSVSYNGYIHEANFDKLNGILREESNESPIEKFKSHPLLTYENKTLAFRYDFFPEYFRSIALSMFLREIDFNKIDNDIIDIIIQYVSYDNSFTRSIIKRFINDDFLNLKNAVFDFLQIKLNERNDISEDKKCQLSSSLFILILALGTTNNTVEERTLLLKELYETNGTIENLFVMNLHASKGKLVFDFKGLKFKNCIFQNYEYFSICEYDEETYFTDTKFLGLLHREGADPKIREKHVDKSSCDMTGIIDIIHEKEKLYKDEELALRANLKRIFKFFWQNSSFKQKLTSEADKKLRDISRILEVLIKNKIIQEVSVKTKQKSKDRAYLVNPDYSELRKIMEENNTCLEFEKIVKIFNNH